MKIIIYFLLFYFILLGTSYYFQDKFIFLPEKLSKNHHFLLPPFAKEISLQTSDNVNLNAILFENPKNKKIVIYFHGNAGSLENWKDIAEDIFTLGVNVLIIDYRGYGKSEGTFSESGLYADAEAAYDYTRKLGYADKQIIFYGRSLGTGVAMEMAIRHPVNGLILETPYTKLSQLAMKHYWYLLPNLFLRYQFNNIDKASKLQIPVLILHGTKDEVIPLSHSEALDKAILTQHVLIIFPEATHNNLGSFPLFKEKVKEFIKQ